MMCLLNCKDYLVFDSDVGVILGFFDSKESANEYIDSLEEHNNLYVFKNKSIGHIEKE